MACMERAEGLLLGVFLVHVAPSHSHVSSPPKLAEPNRNTRALPLWNLLREPKQLVLVDGAGHLPPLEARVPAINKFLDQMLGPVTRNR